MRNKEKQDPMIEINGHQLHLHNLIDVARKHKKVRLSEKARQNMMRSYLWVKESSQTIFDQNDDLEGQEQPRKQHSKNIPIYGVNTGFGSLARIRIPPQDSSKLSINLIRSHAAGVGPIAPKDVTRATMVLRANALAKGVSGCRPDLVDLLLEMLNRDLTPKIPLQGSCGSSGDLAPLAHLGLVMIGDEKGEAWVGKELLSAPEALKKVGLQPLQLEAKDGLAITNGAQLSTAITALSLYDAQNIVLSAEIFMAMSMEALLGISRAFDKKVHQMRPYKGAQDCAHNIRSLIEGSNLVDSVPEKLQDAYSIRCTPQVVGAARDNLEFIAKQVGIELNAATDNPLILLPEDGSTIESTDVYIGNYAYSAGMFHGEPMGMAADLLKIAVAEIGSLSERRLYRLTTGNLSQLLPPGLEGRDRPVVGMMVPQTTAAALVSENKALGWPATMDSIPTCEDQEDHIAMSTVAARRAQQVVQNTQKVIAIEALCAAHALEYRRESGEHIQFGIGAKLVLPLIEAILYDIKEDATIGEQIEAIADNIQQGLFVEELCKKISSLRKIFPSGDTQ